MANDDDVKLLRDNLYPAGDWTFTHRAGGSTESGKVYYPALLRLNLDKREALELIQSLARFVGHKERERQDFNFVGTIERGA